MIAIYITKKLLNNKIPFILKTIIKIMVWKRNKLLKKYWEFNSYNNIEWDINFDIDINSFDINKRKSWISLFARLKNSSDFLIESIESHINLVDEIILVDNNSTDNTKKICKNMEKKYPNKIKYYDYKPEVYTYWHPEWDKIPNNSTKSMAYYYNWTLSKTTYKYVAKLDDDMIAYNWEYLSNLIKNIKDKWLNKLEILPQYNIVAFDNTLKIPLRGSSKILPLFWWTYLDHGFFPISKYTYFIRWKTCEAFLFPFNAKINIPCYFHLKGMKKEAWTKQYLGDIRKKAFDLMTTWIFIKLPEKLRNELSKWVNLEKFN